jgi:hypothetical protein
MSAAVVLGCAAALAAGAFAAAGVGAVPANTTYKPAGLALSFVLPSDWGGATGTGAFGLRFEGIGPASVATLNVFTTKTTASLSALSPRLRSAVRQHYAQADAHASSTARSAEIDSSVPALQITVRYHGLWKAGVGDITHVLEFFVHGGLLYEFDYMAVAPWAARYLPVFAVSTKSIHFLQVA